MNSNLVFVLLLLFAAALIVFAVLPPLRRWQRDREWEEFGTDLDIGGAIAGRIDGDGRSTAAPSGPHLVARTDPTGGQDGERTHTDIALEELRRLERLNLSNDQDDEFDAFEEYLSGRRQERSRHSARGGSEPREIAPAGPPTQDGYPAAPPRQAITGTGPQRDAYEPERVADQVPAAHVPRPADGRPVDGRPADAPRETTGEIDLLTGRPPARNGAATTSGPGAAGIEPNDTAEDLVRAAGSRPGGPPEGEPYDWKAAAQYERARAARAGGPGRQQHSGPPRPPKPPPPPDDAPTPPPPTVAPSPSSPPRWHVIRADESEPAPVQVVQPQARQHGEAGVRAVGPPHRDGAPVEAPAQPERALPDQAQPDRSRPQPEPEPEFDLERELQPQAAGYVATPPGSGSAQARAASATAPADAPAEPQDALPVPPEPPTERPEDPFATQEPSPPPAPEPSAPAQPALATSKKGAGSGSASDLPPVLSEDEINDLRSRWLEVKASFPDDPIAAVREAKQLVNECTDLLAERLEVRRDQGEVSTEDLRLALRRYVAFYERLLWS